jgi:peptidoglycan-N-acetylglucosamine deacetylase
MQHEPSVASVGPDVLFTVDVEPDCPPYLDGWRGVTEGLPWLLEALAEEDVAATFFTTGVTAERHSSAIAAIPAAGHELACHGHTHRRFGTMTAFEAAAELGDASGVLRAIAPVSAFRAPNLDMPDALLPLLLDAGYRIDSSEGSHRLDHRMRRWARADRAPDGLLRIPASTTSSVLRLPPSLRDPWLARLSRPVVLFIHPWELVDLRGEPIRWDCRAGTGARARDAVREVIRLFRARGMRFGTMQEWAAGTRGAA